MGESCPMCGRENRAHASFCRGCGSVLGAAFSPAAPTGTAEGAAAHGEFLDDTVLAAPGAPPTEPEQPNEPVNPSPGDRSATRKYVWWSAMASAALLIVVGVLVLRGGDSATDSVATVDPAVPTTPQTIDSGDTTVESAPANSDSDSVAPDDSVAAEGSVAPPDDEEPEVPGFVPLAPARLVDTRSTGVTVDGKSAGAGSLKAGSEFTFSVGSRGGVGSDAGAVSLNVTVVEPSRAGFLSVVACGDDSLAGSTLNFNAGESIANSVIVGLGSGVCIRSSAKVDVLVDVNGYFTQP